MTLSLRPSRDPDAKAMRDWHRSQEALRRAQSVVSGKAPSQGEGS